MKRALFLFVWTLAACSIPVDAPPPPTSIFSATPQPAVSTLTALPATPAPETFCQDAQALQLLSDLKTAVQTRDGELLASLVSPTSGVGVRFIRDGNVVTYFDNIKFIFETTYDANWGLAPGSGEPVKGSFQEIVLPSLERVLTSDPLLTCNDLKVGGATYIPDWPYEDMDYYSLHFPGTDQYSGMDWETWAVGMVYEEGKPMLAALVHFAWEP
ncbi:MAG: hypothetical protein Fur0017_22310 [Anaerolineales bacterium]